MSNLLPGRIIRAEIIDRNGYKKERPAVIVSPVPTDDDSTFIVFALTTRFEKPHPPNEVFLEADPERTRGTWVKKDCIVACWWANEITRKDVIETAGMIEAPQILIIRHFFKQANFEIYADGGSEPDASFPPADSAM